MLKPQYLNLVNSSFLLWLDNQILTKGSGFNNISSYFYPIGQIYSGVFGYAAPLQPFVSNVNISEANVPTGIFLSGSFVQRGKSGFIDFDYNRGVAYFSNNIGDYTKVSGSYSVKDINVLPLNINESLLLFETQFKLRATTSSPTATGIFNDSYTYPAVYVKSEASENKPFALGGQDESETNIGVFMFCDSSYQLDALKSILMDSAHSYIPLLTEDKFPYNIYGGFKNTGINFNYNTLLGIIPSGSGLYIKDVNISTFGNGLGRSLYSELMSLNRDVYWAIADFTVCRPRFPRANRNF